MRRMIGAAALILTLAACAGGLLVARGSAVAPLILPGSTDVVVISQGVNSIRVEYHATGLPFAWRDALDHQLVDAGWRGREYSFSGTRFPFTVTWYVREFRVGPLTLAEHAVVGGDPDDPYAAKIQVHHELHLNG